AEIISKSDTGNWYVSNSAGGVKSQTVIDSNQNYNMMASTTNTKTYDTTNTTVTDMHVGEVDKKAGASIEVGASYQKGIAKNRTSVSGKLTVEGSLEKKDVDTDGTVTVTNKGTDTDHTDDSLNESTNEHYASSLNTSSWNSESGYGASSTTCKSTTVAEKLSEMISEKTGYGSTYITTGDSSTTQGKTESTRESNQYSSSVSYSKIVSEETTVELNTENTMTGYHRWVMAGTAHVFGVVGYDIANKCFFTYTYSIMDDKTYRFEDFSYKTADYDDNQCSIINFEIPTDIISYVETRTYGTNGLEYDLDGNVTAYNGTDSYVVIPNYVSVDNLDGTANAVKVTAIAPEAFKNNKNITGVLLSDFITEIPENAFEGCSELWDINGTSIESIGDNAFKDCVKLHSFNVSSDITNLGKNAFAGTDFLEVDAANSNVVSAAIESGARHIVVNLQNLSDSLDGKELVIPEETCLFVLRGYGNSYRNLNIISHARTTKIVRLSIDSDGKIPLELYSPNITMNQCNISNAGIAMVTYEDDVELGLYGEVNVETTAVNAMLCKNISLNQVKDGLATKLNIDGNLVKCGNLQEKDLLNVSGEIISVDEEFWNNLLHSYTLSFDPAGGTCEVTSMKVANSTPVGELPTPVREGFGFAGWFTAEGEQVTSETVFSDGVDITVYAHWTANSYTAVWSEPVGTTITVDRVSSPNGNAETGILSSGDTVYYGDVLAITYTANTGFTLETKGAESITVTSDVTSSDIYASATPDTYKVSWTTGTGYSITVNRTASPYKNASTGELSNNDDIYFSDELSISYAAAEGYTLKSHGETNITVTGHVTSEDIKASVEANEYTYKIVYQSTNGVSLGGAEVTYKFGTTNTISAPAKSGYNTPAPQTVVWDSTSPKTITFKYSPVSVSTSQQMSSGAVNTWSSGKYGVTYVAYAEYQNRTANSVQVRIRWVNTITANTYFGYGQYFTGNIAGTSTGEVTICTNSTWASSSSSSRSATAYSGWITVSVPATQRTVNLSASWRTVAGDSGSWSNTMTIPTY
ncbi:MAG: leucine-rich repeat protein, partial [Agathobacter sp.]